MNRRKFLRTTGMTLSTLPLVRCAGGVKSRRAPGGPGGSGRPNILFIITDQQYAGAMSCAANPDLKTPAMDSIAAGGVMFDRAYCGNPLCVPSRVCMFTGRMPHENGITINRPDREDSVAMPMMGTFFSASGYDCGYVGKWHLGIPPSQKEIHGFSFLAHTRMNKLDADVYPSCTEFLSRERDKPFLLVASFVNPHDICEWARGQELKNGEIPPPPPAGQCPEAPANWAIPRPEPEVIRRHQALSPPMYPTVDWDIDKWRQYRWAYYRMTELVDSRIGRVLDALRATGQYDNTLIVFTSDHGDGLGAHRWNQKQLFYEEPARVPLIVSLAGRTRAGAVDRTTLVSTGEDLIPTMCDFAGVSPPDGLRGVSVRAVAEGATPDESRTFVVSETELCAWNKSHGFTGRMLRTNRYKYAVYSEGAHREQLFDMESDPGEMTNLAATAEGETALREHRNMLAEWCTERNDPFAVPEA